MLQGLEPLLLESASKEDRKKQKRRLRDLPQTRFRRAGSVLSSWVSSINEALFWSAGQGTVSSSSGDDFAQYNAFKKILKDRKIFQERLFLQGGQNTLLLCVPLPREGKMEGIWVFTFRPGDLKDQIGLSEEECLAMDFNP